MNEVHSKFPTLERLALLQVRKQFPQLRRKGFSAAVCAAFRRDQGEDLKRILIIPDGCDPSKNCCPCE
jgi:hypothetical protein